MLNFDHNCQKIIYSEYHGHKGFFHLKILNRLNKLFYGRNIYRKLRYLALLKTFEKIIKTNFYDIIIGFGGGDFFEPLEVISNSKKVNSSTLKCGFVHDPFPVDLYPLPYKGPITKSTIRQKSNLKKIFSNLDKIVFPSLILSHEMNDFYEFGMNKALIIPHGLPAQYEIGDEDELLEFLHKNNLRENEFYFHAGTLLYHRKIEYIVQGFRNLKNKGKINSELKLLFVGNVQYPINLFDDDIVIIPKRLPLKLVNSIALKSKGLMIIEHIGNISPFLPGKFPEYISLKKPIMHFGPLNSEINRIVQEYSKKGSCLFNFSARLNDVNGIENLLIVGGFDFSNNNYLHNYFKFTEVT